MHIALHTNESFSMTRGLNASAESIDPGQPAQSKNYTTA